MWYTEFVNWPIWPTVTLLPRQTTVISVFLAKNNELKIADIFEYLICCAILFVYDKKCQYDIINIVRKIAE